MIANQPTHTHTHQHTHMLSFCMFQGIEELDGEGRVLTTEHEEFYVVSGLVIKVCQWWQDWQSTQCVCPVCSG